MDRRPKGWCDWEGNIACRNYNIGKWHTAEEVTEDWLAIAAAFPYLELRAQVITDEGEGEIAAEWAVREGDAALIEPIGLLEPPGTFSLTRARSWPSFSARDVSAASRWRGWLKRSRRCGAPVPDGGTRSH